MIEKETFIINNRDGSVSLDAYAGMSREDLKTRCRELCRELDKWQHLGMSLYEDGKDSLSDCQKTKIRALIEAYRD